MVAGFRTAARLDQHALHQILNALDIRRGAFKSMMTGTLTLLFHEHGDHTGRYPMDEFGVPVLSRALGSCHTRVGSLLELGPACGT